MPYHYIAAADSAPFSEAPSAIMESLNRLTWASNVVVGGKPYPPRNELLAVGYMETQKMDVSAALQLPLYPPLVAGHRSQNAVP